MGGDDGRESPAVDEYRRLELDRLDALQTALWPQALVGDMAVNTVLRIIEQRTRLLGLGREHLAGLGTGPPTTVVVHSLAVGS